VNVLLEADKLIHGERVETYGKPEESFVLIAKLASLMAGRDITKQDVIFVMVAQKLIRRLHSPDNPDHLIDACGYLGILGDLEVAHERSS
jgi:hypothetical protein